MRTIESWGNLIHSLGNLLPERTDRIKRAATLSFIGGRAKGNFDALPRMEVGTT